MADLLHSLAAVRLGETPTLQQHAQIIVETCVDGLQSHIAAWESLASDAIEPNPFYEHWMLIPAMREIADEDIRVVFVYASSRGATNLCGVFPIARRRAYRNLPIPNFSFWKHKYCFLCTPLLRVDSAQAALGAYLDWFERNAPSWSLVEFNHTSGEGAFPALLKAELDRRRRSRYHTESFQRALIRPAVSEESYLGENISHGRRKEWRRQFNRLIERGRVEFVELEREQDVDRWIRGFMDLEASGWKGRAGSAILLEEPSRRFFSETMREAFRRKRLMMLGLLVDGKPIALKCNILSGSGAFAFKIAYEEQFHRFSPGLQLELETIRRLHRQNSIRWMDSCATPNHVMINSLWAERRRIQTVALPAREFFGGLIRTLVAIRSRYVRTLGAWRQAVKHAA
jgi:CelD/BcsL family acetyltransferase involved in cellulose biosynthesis